MIIDRLTQPPFNTTMLGVLKGALDWYGIRTSPAMAFGGSGHAFLINIHDELCPSGPYCWRYEPFYRLVRNLGVEMVDLGFFHAGSGPAERGAIEAKVRQSIDQGLVCSLVSMEHQLILGYDETRLFTARPWPACSDFPPATLTFGSWSELGDETHVNFFVLREVVPADEAVVVRDALAYAVDLFRNPGAHTGEHYGVGPRAYDNWAKAVEAHGSSHGNWWNATVWSECRAMASAFFDDLAERSSGSAAEAARGLARDYHDIADMLARAADKEMPPAEKSSLVRDLRARELAAIGGVEAYLQHVGAGAAG